MTINTVVYDACVLYSAPLRDLLMQLALTDLFNAKWTELIHTEWINSLLATRPDLSQTDLLRVKDLMNKHVEDALIENFEELIPTLSLPDPKDRHVLAAAIKCSAQAIITFNLKDFPQALLSPYNLEALHPDSFIAHLITSSPGKVASALELILKRLKNPPKTLPQYLDILLQQGLPLSVSLLKDLLPMP